MFRLPRLLAALAVLCFLSSCEVPSAPPVAAPASAADPHQIDWQRSLDDALALAAAEHRPLLIAVNMDGESASDRIVRENYRDPAFVAASRRCVCVVASVFRHNPRDHDDQGRRIACPRLGCVTCGEHMAMEPLLFEKLLADGERVAPRHAVVLPDGKKVFDLSLNFDLRDIDRALVAATNDVTDRVEPANPGTTWEQLAARRDHAGRVALEARLAVGDEDAMIAALDAIARVGDAGSLDALRIVGLQHPGDTPHAGAFFPGDFFSAKLLAKLVATARTRNLETSLAAVWRSWFVDDDQGLMAALAELDGSGAQTRSLLLAHCLLLPEAAAAAISLRRVLPTEAMQAVEAVVHATGGPFSLLGELDRTPVLIETVPNGTAMPETAVLERTLGELEATPRADRGADWNARYAKASLDLGRRHLELRQKNVQLLLEDAEQHWQKALELDGKHAEWWIERARTAYFLGRFADEATYGQRAFDIAAAGKILGSPLQDAAAVEALRWVGDGHARMHAERAGGDAARELRGIAEGLRALARVAASSYGTAKDWLSLASFCGVLGLGRLEVAIAEKGAMRFPADLDLRQYLNAALWNSGSTDRVPTIAEAIAATHPGSADAQWFAGYAHMLVAEHERRTEVPDESSANYAAAKRFFAMAMLLRADYADSCRAMIASSWLGRGLAHAQVGRRAPAADCLVNAVERAANLASARDGLGYDVLDLVDKIFEWRDAGPSDVDPQQLLDRLLDAAPGNPFYGLAIADSQLREALRADGRNPHRTERDTVDAGGKPIRMAMGLPTDEGDAYLRASIAAARRVLPFVATDEDRSMLAQSDTIWAERMLERNRLDDVQGTLTEAASLLGQQAPPADADTAMLRKIAVRLRALLGEARPRQREGR